MMQDHPERTLTSAEDGTFSLARAGGGTTRAIVDGTGWRLEGEGIDPGWRLERLGAEEGWGFRLVTHGEPPQESSCTLRGWGEPEGSGARQLLLEDGRLFRIVPRGAPDPRHELLSWESPGAYLVARAEASGWRIEPQPACAALADVRALLVLFAAEILDAAERLPPGEDR